MSFQTGGAESERTADLRKQQVESAAVRSSSRRLFVAFREGRSLVRGSAPHHRRLILECDLAAMDGTITNRHLIMNTLEVGGVDGIRSVRAHLLHFDLVDHLNDGSLVQARPNNHVGPGEFERTILIVTRVRGPESG